MFGFFLLILFNLTSYFFDLDNFFFFWEWGLFGFTVWEQNWEGEKRGAREHLAGDLLSRKQKENNRKWSKPSFH